MGKKDKTAKVAPENKSPAEPLKTTAKPRKSERADAVIQDGFGFSGRINRIKVSLADALKVEFELLGKGGKSEICLLDSSDIQRFTAMISLLAAASTAQSKVSVRSAEKVEGRHVINELEIHARRSKHKK
jgi:hypothetical protein